MSTAFPIPAPLSAVMYAMNIHSECVTVQMFSLLASVTNMRHDCESWLVN